MADEELTRHITVKSWKDFPLRSETRQGGPLSLVLLGILARVISQEKKIKGLKIRNKEVNLSVCKA